MQPHVPARWWQMPLLLLTYLTLSSDTLIYGYPFVDFTHCLMWIKCVGDVTVCFLDHQLLVNLERHSSPQTHHTPTHSQRHLQLHMRAMSFYSRLTQISAPSEDLLLRCCITGKTAKLIYVHSHIVPCRSHQGYCCTLHLI